MKDFNEKFYRAPNSGLVGRVLGKIIMFGIGFFTVLILRVIFSV